VRSLVATHASTHSKSEEGRSLDTLDFKESVIIGTSQIAALFAGISRSGITMVAGLARGLDHEDAARFSFLLATPIIMAAAVLEVPKLLQPDNRAALPAAVIGGVVAGVLAYLSTAFLMRYFKQQEVNALLPFAGYCVIVGGAALLFGQ
jgi:undecaprenyl-diphosphatase